MQFQPISNQTSEMSWPCVTRWLERHGSNGTISSIDAVDGLACHRWLQYMEANAEKEAIVHWVAGEGPFRWTWGAYIDASGKLGSDDVAELVYPDVATDRKLVAAWKRKLRTPGESYLLFTSQHISRFGLWPS